MRLLPPRFAFMFLICLATMPAARAQNYQQLAAQMDALADQCHAQYVQEMKDSNSSAASADLAAEQKYRKAAIDLRAKASNAGVAGGGGYSTPNTGNAKLNAANQVVSSLAGMAAILQQSQDRQDAEAAQAAQQQADRELQQQIDEQKRIVAERQAQIDARLQLNAAHAQYGSFYKTDDVPVTNSQTTSSDNVKGDPVADVLGGSYGTGYGRHDDAVLADVLGGIGQPSPAIDPTPTAISAPATSTQPDTAKSASLVDDILGSPATKPEAGSGAPYFLGTNLNKGPDVGIKLDGPTPNVLNTPPPPGPPLTNGSSPSPKPTSLVDDILASPATMPVTKPEVGPGAPYFIGTNLNKGPDAGINLNGPATNFPESLRAGLLPSPQTPPAQSPPPKAAQAPATPAPPASTATPATQASR